MTRVLIAASECVPLVKTGGLADVIGALPAALAGEGTEARVILPGYPAVLSRIGAEPLGKAGGATDLGAAPGLDTAVSGPARLLAARVGELDLFVLDAPERFSREGGLYETGGRDWPDNAERFAALSQAAAGVAQDGVTLGDGTTWRPDVLHANDWQTGLAPIYAALRAAPSTARRVPSVLTIHNISYQGLMDAALAPHLGLPPAGFGQGWEFHGRLGFLKGGLMVADRITTVSPGYAREILTPEFGMGLEGVLKSRETVLSGILNGADTAVWDPATDAAITSPFDATDLAGKTACRDALLQEFGLEPGDGPLVGLVSRLTWQKGIDLLVEALPRLLSRGGRLAVLGSGETGLETALRNASHAYRGQVGVRIGYDEALSHRIFAGSDAVAVPSRFEPCGLTQLYALRYGALPVVARTGGLGDTVIDATPAALMSRSATGFVHTPGDADSLAHAFDRLADAMADAEIHTAMQRSAMDQPVGWGPSARDYAALYRGLLG
ncbi:MAG: glycogen synthase GlgA [Pseudomonadota bacterium]